MSKPFIVTEPSAPAGISARVVAADQSSFSVELTWTTPASGGAPLSGYRLLWQHAHPNSTWSLPARNGSLHVGAGLSSAVVSNLSTHTSYYFRVQAVNAMLAGMCAPRAPLYPC